MPRSVGHSEALLGLCEAMHLRSSRCTSAFKPPKPTKLLGQSVETADELLISASPRRADALYLPFVENYRYLKTALTRGAGAICRVCPDGHTLGEDFLWPLRRRKRAEAPVTRRPRGLTERKAPSPRSCKSHEQPRDRRALFLSEGCVKQYINLIILSSHQRAIVRTKRKGSPSLPRRRAKAQQGRSSLYCIDIPKNYLTLVNTKFFRSPYNGCTVGSFIFRRGGNGPLYRKYISAVHTRSGLHSGWDFVSGSATAARYDDVSRKLRLPPDCDPAVWNSAMT